MNRFSFLRLSMESYGMVKVNKRITNKSLTVVKKGIGNGMIKG